MVRRTSSKRLPTGVQVRDGAVRIYFFDHNGERRFITLPHPPTAAGIKAAAETRGLLVNQAKWGILTEEKICEICGIVYEDSPSIPTFGEYAESYLAGLTCVAGTKKKYKGILNKYWYPVLEHMPISYITAKLLRDHFNSIEFNSEKTRNDVLIPLRGTFALALDDDLIDKDPTTKLKNTKIQEAEPDPFTPVERTRILERFDQDMEGWDRIFYWYYMAAFWTGCRPSELIALKWSDIDWKNECISITKALVNGVYQEKTKVSQFRLVYLNKHSKLAFEELQIRYQRASKDGFIFIWEDGERWANERSPRERFKVVLTKEHIRQRHAYNCRHTYATQMLMDGINPAFAANQMGHSLMMFTKTYSRWLHGDRSRQEISKLNG